jgi:hypothetical protein
MNSLCQNEIINIWVEIQISDDEISIYKQIKEEYDYYIFNFYDPFYLNNAQNSQHPTN